MRYRIINLNAEREELRMLYQIDTGAIQDFKRRQWEIVFYGLALLGALIAFHSKLMRPINLLALNKWMLYVEFALEFTLAILICAAGWIILGGLEIAIKKCRKRKKKAMEEFQQPFKNAMCEADQLSNHDDIKWFHAKDFHDVSPFGLFLSVLVAGTFFTVCYLVLDLICQTGGNAMSIALVIISSITLLLIVALLFIIILVCGKTREILSIIKCIKKNVENKSKPVGKETG